MVCVQGTTYCLDSPSSRCLRGSEATLAARNRTTCGEAGPEDGAQEESPLYHYLTVTAAAEYQLVMEYVVLD